MQVVEKACHCFAYLTEIYADSTEKVEIILSTQLLERAVPLLSDPNAVIGSRTKTVLFRMFSIASRRSASIVRQLLDDSICPILRAFLTDTEPAAAQNMTSSVAPKAEASLSHPERTLEVLALMLELMPRVMDGEEQVDTKEMESEQGDDLLSPKALGVSSTITTSLGSSGLASSTSSTPSASSSSSSSAGKAVAEQTNQTRKMLERSTEVNKEIEQMFQSDDRYCAMLMENLLQVRKLLSSSLLYMILLCHILFTHCHSLL